MFNLGRIVATRGALNLLAEFDKNPRTFLQRHQAGDWGDILSMDKSLNDAAVVRGGRIHSAYDVAPGRQVWIITEADRAATTILLPSEY